MAFKGKGYWLWVSEHDVRDDSYPTLGVKGLVGKRGEEKGTNVSSQTLTFYPFHPQPRIQQGIYRTLK